MRKNGGARRSLVRRTLLRCTAAGAALLGLYLAQAPGAQPARRSEESYAVVAGTVFREDGRVLPGAGVAVKPDPKMKPSGKIKPVSVVSDARGEFAVRVPAAPMRYTITVRASGFRMQQKDASIAGDERVDVFFQLEREPAGK